MVQARSSLLWQTVRGWAQPCRPCPEPRSSPGTTGKQVVSYSRTCQASRSPGTDPAQEQLHLSPFLSAQPSIAQQCNSRSPTTAPQSQPPLSCPEQKHTMTEETHSSSPEQKRGQIADGCGIWRTASRRPLAMTKAKAHRIVCNSALRPCHFIQGPKIEVLQSLCWSAKA